MIIQYFYKNIEMLFQISELWLIELAALVFYSSIYKKTLSKFR